MPDICQRTAPSSSPLDLRGGVHICPRLSSLTYYYLRLAFITTEANVPIIQYSVTPATKRMAHVAIAMTTPPNLFSQFRRDIGLNNHDIGKLKKARITCGSLCLFIKDTMKKYINNNIYIPAARMPHDRFLTSLNCNFTKAPY